MSTIAQVATALKTTIAAATSLRGYDYVPDDLNPPAFLISIDSIDVGAFKLGEMDITFQVVVFTSKASDRVGQGALYAYMASTGASSVWLAVYNTPALGLSDTSAAVKSARTLGIEEVAAYGYYGAVFDVLVLTSGA